MGTANTGAKQLVVKIALMRDGYRARICRGGRGSRFTFNHEIYRLFVTEGDALAYVSDMVRDGRLAELETKSFLDASVPV